MNTLLYYRVNSDLSPLYNDCIDIYLFPFAIDHFTCVWLQIASIMQISADVRCKFTFHMQISPFRKFSCRCISFGKCHLTWICYTCICICIWSTLDRELLLLCKYHLIWVYAEFNPLREYHFIGILAWNASYYM